jgi:L-lactate dehydrogenase complex protein LldE
VAGPVVQLFVTCLVDGIFPEVGEAVVTVLERAGCTVDFPMDQTCCGQPAFNTGLEEDARRMASYTVGVLDRTTGPVVVPSGSCSDMLIHHAPKLLADDPAESAAASRVARRVRELTTFLVDDLGVTELGARCHRQAVYHPSCHGLRNLGLRGQAEALLDRVAGLNRSLLPNAEECCGFGGLFSVEMPEVSAAMMKSKIDRVESTGADLLVGGDVSCLMHLAGGLHRRGSPIEVRHIAQVLAGDEG